MSKLFNVLKEDIRLFLLEKDLLQLVLAVYLGEVLKDFFEAFVDDLLIPFVEELSPDKDTSLRDFNVEYKGVSFKIGQLLKQTLMLVIAFFLSYFFTKVLFRIFK